MRAMQRMWSAGQCPPIRVQEDEKQGLGLGSKGSGECLGIMVGIGDRICAEGFGQLGFDMQMY